MNGSPRRSPAHTMKRAISESSSSLAEGSHRGTGCSDVDIQLLYPFRRPLGGRLCSRSVDAAALRSEFPVLERLAYLNAGTDGPLPRAGDQGRRAGARA